MICRQQLTIGQQIYIFTTCLEFPHFMHANSAFWLTAFRLFGIMTLGILTFGIMTFGMTFDGLTFGIMTYGILSRFDMRILLSVSCTIDALLDSLLLGPAETQHFVYIVSWNVFWIELFSLKKVLLRAHSIRIVIPESKIDKPVWDPSSKLISSSVWLDNGELWWQNCKLSIQLTKFRSVVHP